jgi:hypothetical protein
MSRAGQRRGIVIPAYEEAANEQAETGKGKGGAAEAAPVVLGAEETGAVNGHGR